MKTDYLNVFYMEDAETAGMYRVVTYCSYKGIWNASELMSLDEAKERIRLGAY